MKNLTGAESNRCVLLASPVCDRYLWREVVQHRGYDVLAKSASHEELIRTLRFAWRWRTRGHIGTSSQQ